MEKSVKQVTYDKIISGLEKSLKHDEELQAYERTDIWIEQSNLAFEAFNQRTENGLITIEMLIDELEQIKKGILIY